MIEAHIVPDYSGIYRNLGNYQIFRNLHNSEKHMNHRRYKGHIFD